MATMVKAHVNGLWYFQQEPTGKPWALLLEFNACTFHRCKKGRCWSLYLYHDDIADGADELIGQIDKGPYEFQKALLKLLRSQGLTISGGELEKMGVFYAQTACGVYLKDHESKECERGL